MKPVLRLVLLVGLVSSAAMGAPGDASVAVAQRIIVQTNDLDVMKDRAVELAAGRLVAYFRMMPEAEEKIPGVVATLHRIVRSTYDVRMPELQQAFITKCGPVLADGATLEQLQAIEAFFASPAGKKLAAASLETYSGAKENNKAFASIGKGKPAELTTADALTGVDPMAVLSAMTPDEAQVFRQFLRSDAGQYYLVTGARALADCMVRETNSANLQMGQEMQAELQRVLGPRLAELDRTEAAAREAK